MKILVTNDDGIFAEGLWALVRELKNMAQVIVVAPDREKSATGTAVTLRHPLKIQKVKPQMPEIETYSVEGTPSDSVILALGRLVQGKIDMVISGINNGSNLGDDVHISGTVGAALQGHLHGFPALAISVSRGSPTDTAAKFAALLAKKIASDSMPAKLFLNVNLPDLPRDKIGRIQLTHLATESHINTVAEEGDGPGKHYQLIRREINKTKDQNASNDNLEFFHKV